MSPIQDALGSGDGPGDTGIAATLTATGAGNTLAVVGDWYSGAVALTGIESVTDNQGNTWTFSTSDSDNPPSAHTSGGGANYFGSFIAWCEDAAAGVTEVTVKLGTGATCFIAFAASEWTPMNADAGIAGTGTVPGTGDVTPGPLALSGTGETVLATTDVLSGILTGLPAGLSHFTSDSTTLQGWGTGLSGTFSAPWTGGMSGDTFTAALMAFIPSGALAVTTTQLPPAAEDAAYSQALTATGGSGTGYTWSISSGSLPSWASLDASTGVISGTAPGFIQVTSFTVEVTDSLSNTATQPLILPVGPYPDGQPSGGPWLLAFNDDFDVPYPTPYGTGPNPAVWSDRYVYGAGFRCQNGSGPGSDIEWYAHGYYGHSVADSILSLTAIFQNPGSIDPALPSDGVLPNTNQGYYTSGMAASFPFLNFTYGYVEARIQNPAAGVSGDWPAFWHLPFTQWPPEIDSSEYNPPGNDDEIHVGFLDLSSAWHQDFYDSDSDYHVYGMRLDPDFVTFFYDGEQVYQADYTAGALPWHIVLDHAVYSNTTGAGFPTSYNIDYARFWGVQGVPPQPVIAALSPGNTPPAGQVTVSFREVAGATSYRVTAFPQDELAYTGDYSEVDADLIFATGPSSPITVTGLNSGQPYCFTVAAVNGTGYSIESLPVPSFGPAPPAAPPAGGAPSDDDAREFKRRLLWGA